MADPTRLGRYELRRVLGKGAMGVVYEGYDPTLSRRVAVKTILKSVALDDETERSYSERFVREAKAVARLNHPNIVQVYDFGVQSDVAYLVMEFIQGRELRGFFVKGERFEAAEAVRIMGELLDALDFAHEHGVIHRDVKPANVMLDAQRRVKLADFGVARIQDSDRSAAGTMVGTPAFMSPEQISGGRIDRRTDIFSAGTVLYQLLTGEQPFKGEATWTVAKQIMQDDPPPPSSVRISVSPAFDAVVNKALAKEVAQRYSRAREFAAALRGALGPGAQVAAPAPAAKAKQAPKASETELEFWRSIQNSGDPAEYEVYLKEFPQGSYARLARLKIDHLRESRDRDATVAIGSTVAAPAERKRSFAVPAAIAAFVMAGGAAVYLMTSRTSMPPVPVTQAPVQAPPSIDVEKALRQAEERIRREFADRMAEEKAALEKAAAAGRLASEKAAAEKVTAEKAAEAARKAAENVASAKSAQEKAALEKIAAAEKAAADRAAAAERAAVAAERAAAERVAAAEKAARLTTERAAEEKAAAAKAKATEKAAEPAKALPQSVAAAAPSAAPAAAPREAMLAGPFVFRLMAGAGGSGTCDRNGFEEEIEIRAGGTQGVSGRQFTDLRIQSQQDGSIAGWVTDGSSRDGVARVKLAGRATATGYAGTYIGRYGLFGCSGEWTLARKGERPPAPAKPAPVTVAAAPAAAPTREARLAGRYTFRIFPGSGNEFCGGVDVQEDIEIRAGGTEGISGRLFSDLKLRFANDGTVTATLWEASNKFQASDMKLAGRATGTGYAGTYEMRAGPVACEGQWTLVRKGG